MTSNKLIFLCGFMGSGKTTHGRKLARMLGCGFIDLDKQIEQSENSSIEDIFGYQGENYFREVESRVLKTLQSDMPSVVSLGGGTPCFHDNLDWILAHGLLIYIEMNERSICQRLSRSKKKRPLVQGRSADELLQYVQQLLASRAPYYSRAHIKLNGLNLKTEDIAKAIRDHVSR